MQDKLSGMSEMQSLFYEESQNDSKLLRRKKPVGKQTGYHKSWQKTKYNASDEGNPI